MTHQIPMFEPQEERKPIIDYMTKKGWRYNLVIQKFIWPANGYLVEFELAKRYWRARDPHGPTPF